MMLRYNVLIQHTNVKSISQNIELCCINIAKYKFNIAEILQM